MDPGLQEKLRQASDRVAAAKPREALRLVAEALGIARRLGDSHAMARALSIATLAHYYRGDFVSAVATGIDACASAKGDDPEERSAALYGVALAFLAVRDFRRGERAARDGVRFAALARNAHHGARARNALASLLAEEDRFEEALDAFRAAAARFRRIGEPERASRCVMNMGSTCMRRGIRQSERGEQARRSFQQAKRHFRLVLEAPAFQSDAAYTECGLAECSVLLGELAAARSHLRRSARLGILESSLNMRAYHALVRGVVEGHLGHWAEAEASLRGAIALNDRESFDDQPAQCREELARQLGERGDRVAAERLRREALHLREGRQQALAEIRRQMQPLWDRHLRAA